LGSLLTSLCGLNAVVQAVERKRRVRHLALSGLFLAYLLRRSYREDGKVKNETLGNLSHLPDALIDIIRRSLQGETFVAASQAFEGGRSSAHGHVQAVSLAMLASRIVQPDTKLATSRRWHCSTLAEDFGVTEAAEDELYAAMDWLLARQDGIEHKLATRHLREGALVLYDLSSSYFEGSCCPLAKRGNSRDGRPGTLQVNYGLLTDARGCPMAVSVFEGNTSDSLTFLPAVQRVRERFGLAQVVMMGTRGMVLQKAIHPGAQHLPHPQRWRRCADLRSPHHRHLTPAARLGADPGHSTVVRNPNQRSIASG
jgi:hypothetical protein